MKNKIIFFGICILAFIFWKIFFSTDLAKNSLKAAVAPSHTSSLASSALLPCPEGETRISGELACIPWSDFTPIDSEPAPDGSTQNLTAGQIKQIEDIARNIAKQSNLNKQAMLDDMTVSFNAIAIGRNVRFENVIRVKKNLPSNTIREWLEATRAEIIPKSCRQNAQNPAFDRGLSYTFAYSNTYGEKLGDVFVDKSICRNIGL